MALTLADQGNRTTPSYVAFTEGERLIGDGEWKLSEECSWCSRQESERYEPPEHHLRRQALDWSTV